MDINDWLKQNAEKVPCPLSDDGEIWITKSRGDYITRVGMEDGLGFLADLGITDFVSSSWEAGKPINIGFNPAERMWYGWSHRAIFRFGIGSECKKGDCHYRPVDKDDFLEDMVRFWSDDSHLNVVGEHRNDGVYVEWETSHSVPNKKMRGQISGSFSHYPEEYGRGEWKAETMADARQMAIDFAEDVS